MKKSCTEISVYLETKKGVKFKLFGLNAASSSFPYLFGSFLWLSRKLCTSGSLRILEYLYKSNRFFLWLSLGLEYTLDMPNQIPNQRAFPTVVYLKLLGNSSADSLHKLFVLFKCQEILLKYPPKIDSSCLVFAWLYSSPLVKQGGFIHNFLIIVMIMAVTYT